MFVMADLWAGVRKSKKQGKCSVSYGFRRTVEKTCKYYNYLLALIVIDAVQMALFYVLNSSNGYSFWVIPFATIAGSIFIGFIEVKSIFEKEDKKERKNIEESAVMMAKIAEMLADREALHKLKEFLEHKEKKDDI
jgi:predicted secreted protein